MKSRRGRGGGKTWKKGTGCERMEQGEEASETLVMLISLNHQVMARSLTALYSIAKAENLLSVEASLRIESMSIALRFLEI